MNRLITLFGPSRVICTANSRMTLCAFCSVTVTVTVICGCWLTPLRRILVFFSHHPKTLKLRRYAMFLTVTVTVTVTGYLFFPL
jgi:hypothetical protein